MLIKHLIIPFSPNYCKEFVAKNNTSSRNRIWDFSTFRGENELLFLSSLMTVF